MLTYINDVYSVPVFSTSGSATLEYYYIERRRKILWNDRSVRMRARLRQKRTPGDPVHEQWNLVGRSADLLTWVFDLSKQVAKHFVLTIDSRVGAKCPLLPTIKNGFVVDTSREYFYGDEARVQCNRGYKLSGSNIIQCGPNQRFDNVPTCEGRIANIRQICSIAFAKKLFSNIISH